MSIQHAKPYEIVQLPLGMDLANSKTTTLVKFDDPFAQSAERDHRALPGKANYLHSRG